MKFSLYTDGSYGLSHKTGGWAFVIEEQNSRVKRIVQSGSLDESKAVRMEIIAVLQGLQHAKIVCETGAHLRIVTDCASTAKTIDQLLNGTAPMSDDDLWNPIAEILPLFAVLPQHVRRNSLSQMKECDQLAGRARNLREVSKKRERYLHRHAK